MLKFYTFLDHETILDLQDKTEKSPELRLAQKALACELTTMIHGSEICESVQPVVGLLFHGQEFNLSDSGVEMLKSIIPVSTKAVTALHDLKSVMVETKLVGSITQATQAIREKAVTLFNRDKTPVNPPP